MNGILSRKNAEIREFSCIFRDVYKRQEEKEEYQPQSMEEINIKNDLERFYNISASNINISIQR